MFSHKYKRLPHLPRNVAQAYGQIVRTITISILLIPYTQGKGTRGNETDGDINATILYDTMFCISVYCTAGPVFMLMTKDFFLKDDVPNKNYNAIFSIYVLVFNVSMRLTEINVSTFIILYTHIIIFIYN